MRPASRWLPLGAGLLATAVLSTAVVTISRATSSPDVSAGASGLTVNTTQGSPPVPAPSSSAVASPSGTPAPVALPPGPARIRPDVLVAVDRPLAPDVLGRLTGLAAPGGSAAFRTGSVRVAGQPLATVAVDPHAFRRFAAEGTAEADGVWEAVARGEAVASHAAATRLKVALGGTLALPRPDGTTARVRLGALATTGLPATDLVVDDRLGDVLGLPPTSGVLLGAGRGTDAVALAGKAREVTGAGARVDLLTPPEAPVAFLSGSSSAKAFGAFSYRYFPDGTIEPDAAWVRKNIVTSVVPVFGKVTCHRLMIKQLRGALAEVEARGLAGSLHTYDGCYVPRFIERNPENSISLHTWGIAIDLDASTNYRGIAGTMDPAVVAIFKRWGFRWGGDWAYTDPMHFELGARPD